MIGCLLVQNLIKWANATTQGEAAYKGYLNELESYQEAGRVSAITEEMFKEKYGNKSLDDKLKLFTDSNASNSLDERYRLLCGKVDDKTKIILANMRDRYPEQLGELYEEIPDPIALFKGSYRKVLVKIRALGILNVNKTLNWLDGISGMLSVCRKVISVLNQTKVINASIHTNPMRNMTAKEICGCLANNLRAFDEALHLILTETSLLFGKDSQQELLDFLIETDNLDANVMKIVREFMTITEALSMELQMIRTSK
ncbi:hypothetical protein ENBRE01_1179 [Enteropsectra breve]|nr:hypothetical protein ENBRE01_1179 [Enteropsectra breve]